MNSVPLLLLDSSHFLYHCPAEKPHRKPPLKALPLLFCIQTLPCSPLVNIPAPTEEIFPEAWQKYQKYHSQQHQVHPQSWFALVLPPSSSSILTSSQPCPWHSTAHQDPARAFASQQQLLRTAQREFDFNWLIYSILILCPRAGQTSTRFGQLSHTKGTWAPGHLLGIYLPQRKLKYSHFVGFSYFLRGEHFSPSSLLFKIHVPSRLFLSVKKINFSNIIFTEGDWVKLPRAPQVIWKAKQCIDKTHTLNINIAYL